MTIQRILPHGVISEIEKQSTEEALLVFLTIDHESFFEPIRVVSDPENFMLGGFEFVGFDFNINLLSDGDGPPKARLSIQNVDEKIGQSILESTSPVYLTIEIVALSEFNMKTFPREPLNDPVVYTYRAAHLRLTEVSGNLMAISGTIRSWDYSQETYPAMKATESRFPALFWS